jgi:hypothetical protein
LKIDQSECSKSPTDLHHYIFIISLRTTEHNLINLTLRVFTMRYYTSVVSLVQIGRRLWTFWLIDFQEPLNRSSSISARSHIWLGS